MIEKICNDILLTNYMQISISLSNFYHGVRRGRSTTTQLIKTVDNHRFVIHLC